MIFAYREVHVIATDKLGVAAAERMLNYVKRHLKLEDRKTVP
jgi:hypothetical protein